MQNLSSVTGLLCFMIFIYKNHYITGSRSLYNREPERTKEASDIGEVASFGVYKKVPRASFVLSFVQTVRNSSLLITK